jgi:DNA-binding CsgD family transcriptional regulator/N-acetylneuraminic acid mutarotase
MTEPNFSKSVTSLSQREIEILRLVVTGATNQQIATQLNITSNTVKVHLRNIFAKIDVSSRTEASLYAVRTGLVEVEPQPEDVQATSTAEPNDVPAIQNEELFSAVAKNSSSQSTTTLASKLSIGFPDQPAKSIQPGIKLWFMIIIALLLLVGIGIWITQLMRPSLPQQTTTIPSPEAPSQLWNRRTPMNTLRKDFGITNYNGKIYVLGGTGVDSVTGVMERYNPQSDTWTQLSPKPTPVTDIQMVAIGNRLYVAGGKLKSGTVTDQLEVYDPEVDQWQTLVALPEPRSGYAAASVDGKLYLFGGWDGTDYRDETWMFDPDTETWQARTAMPQARAQMGVVVISNRIHLIGGEDTNGLLTLHQSYDPFQDEENEQPWRVWPRLPQPSNQIAAVAVLNSIYIFNIQHNNLLVYDINNETWNSFETALPENLNYLTAVLLNAHVYLIGLVDNNQGFHVKYQVLYQTQLPLITR